MELKSILKWVCALASVGISVFALYQNYQDFRAVNLLIKPEYRDSSLIVLTHPPSNFERVRSYVETHIIDLDHPDTLDVRFSRLKAEVKTPLFPLNTNNEKDTSFLVMEVDTSFKMIGDTESILIGNHLDTAGIAKIKLRVKGEDDFLVSNESCALCSEINALADCFINRKNSEEVQVIFYTLPQSSGAKLPFMTYLSESDTPLVSQTRRYFAEDIPREISIKAEAGTYIDIHVFDMPCASIIQDKPAGEQFQFIQPGLIWSKTVPVTTMLSY